MNFRQRIAWLCIVFYLAATYVILRYYLFDAHEQYKLFAVQHVQKYHSPGGIKLDKVKVGHIKLDEEDTMEEAAPFFSHINDIPPTMLFLIIVIPYMQVFALLLACTKPDPRQSVAVIWPLVVYNKLESCFCPARIIKKSNIVPLSNGHPIVQT